MKSHSCISNNL